jgi:hypothetical protein
VEALLAVAGLFLVGFGLWTRLRRHAPDPDGHRAREGPGQSALLLGAGLCLLLNDPFVLAAFAFLYYLWWACGRAPGSLAADRKPPRPIRRALVARIAAGTGARGHFRRALGREGDVMGCAVALAAWLGYRDWLAGWHSLAAFPGRGTLVVIGLVLIALVWRRALPELRRCRG